MIKARVVETVVETCEDTLQSIYCDSNEPLKSAMFNIVEHALKEVVCAGGNRVFEEIQFAHLMQSESRVEQIFKSGLSSTKFIVPMAESLRNLVDKSFDNECSKNLDGT